MSGPGEKAIEAARGRFNDDPLVIESVDMALDAAHDPALGLERSVCLRDVVAWLHECADNAILEIAAYYFNNAADAVEREFGGKS